MILSNQATFDLLGALAEVGPEGATVEHLLHKADLVRSTFYRVLKPLVQRGLVREHEGRYVLPMEHPYAYRFKGLYDLERLYELPEQERDRVLAVLEHARVHLKGNLLALWLVGSAAHRRLHPGSDLDFLAVLDREQEYLPETPYPLQFATMTKEEFWEGLAGREGFLLTALRYGLLLEDRGFAQAPLSETIPVELSGRQFHEEEEFLEQQREKLLFFLDRKAPGEAASALSGYAVQLCRRMLRVYDLLPAGKPELLRASGMLFGEVFTDAVQAAIQSTGRATQKRKWRDVFLRQSHQLQEYHQRFSSHLAHIESSSGLLAAGRLGFEQGCAQLLREFFPDCEMRSEERGRDLVLEGPDGTLYLVEMKSLEGPCTTAPVRQLLRARQRFSDSSVVPILVASPFRSVPLLERPEPFDEEVRELAHQEDVLLRSVADLLQAQNRWVLEGLSRKRLGEQFLGVAKS